MTLFEPSEGKTMGIVKNRTIVFQTALNKYVTFAKLVWRYGYSFLKFMYQGSNNLENFNQVYNHLNFNNPKPFTNLTQFLNITHQLDTFNKTTYDYFVNVLGYSELLVTELL